MNSTNFTDIDSHYSLTGHQIDFYRENEYIKLSNVLSPETLQFYKKAIWQRTLELNENILPMEQRDTYSRAFIQVMNLWKHSAEVAKLVMGRRLAAIATELMEVDGVRLYHDQALFKEPQGGFTPWHADQQYWPLMTNKTITAWIPLQAVSMAMGPLSFAAGSHKNPNYRELSIGDESEQIIQKVMNDYELDCSPFDLGDVSFHSGWMYHRAPANTSDQMRGIFTIIYMDEKMRLKMPDNDNQQNDRQLFCPGVQVGEVCNSDLNPTIYKRN